MTKEMIKEEILKRRAEVENHLNPLLTKSDLSQMEIAFSIYFIQKVNRYDSILARI